MATLYLDLQSTQNTGPYTLYVLWSKGSYFEYPKNPMPLNHTIYLSSIRLRIPNMIEGYWALRPKTMAHTCQTLGVCEVAAASSRKAEHCMRTAGQIIMIGNFELRPISRAVFWTPPKSQTLEAQTLQANQKTAKLLHVPNNNPN